MNQTWRLLLPLAMIALLTTACKAKQQCLASESEAQRKEVAKAKASMLHVFALSVDTDTLSMTLTADSARTPGGAVLYGPRMTAAAAGIKAVASDSSLMAVDIEDSLASSERAKAKRTAKSEPSGWPRPWLALLLLVPLYIGAKWAAKRMG